MSYVGGPRRTRKDGLVAIGCQMLVNSLLRSCLATFAASIIVIMQAPSYGSNGCYDRPEISNSSQHLERIQKVSSSTLRLNGIRSRPQLLDCRESPGRSCTNVETESMTCSQSLCRTTSERMGGGQTMISTGRHHEPSPDGLSHTSHHLSRDRIRTGPLSSLISFVSLRRAARGERFRITRKIIRRRICARLCD